MMTALPPPATTSAAVWRPIPLLPPTTTSFCPAKTGLTVGRPGSSMWWSMPSSQFMLIPTFLSAGCAGGEPAACSPASLAAATRRHIVKSAIRHDPAPPRADSACSVCFGRAYGAPRRTALSRHGPMEGSCRRPTGRGDALKEEDRLIAKTTGTLPAALNKTP
jgi:hypothetical protein